MDGYQYTNCLTKLHFRTVELTLKLHVHIKRISITAIQQLAALSNLCLSNSWVITVVTLQLCVTVE